VSTGTNNTNKEDATQKFVIGKRVPIINPSPSQTNTGMIIKIGTKRVTVRTRKGEKIVRTAKNLITENWAQAKPQAMQYKIAAQNRHRPEDKMEEAVEEAAAEAKEEATGVIEVAPATRTWQQRSKETLMAWKVPSFNATERTRTNNSSQKPSVC
jgi:hypothetical protein